MINKSDLFFILKKTNLSASRLVVLLEEERDYHLVLDSISAKLTTEDNKYLKKTSQILRIYLLTYKHSQDINCDIKDKTFIASILSDNYKFFLSKQHVLPVRYTKDYKLLLRTLKGNFAILPDISKFMYSLGYKMDINILKKWILVIKNVLLENNSVIKSIK